MTNPNFQSNPLKPGDLAYIGFNTVSTRSMVFWGPKRKILECPCHWRKRFVVILKVEGVYCYAALQEDMTRVSAFYFKDLKFIKRIENDRTENPKAY